MLMFERAETSKDTATKSPVSQQRWSAERPRVLVVCCSDGRLQEPIDEFLQNHLNILDYDRLYTPGGPAALSDSCSEFTRADIFRRDLSFLLTAHGVTRVILIFHSAAPDGPDEAVCAHYLRTMPGRSREQIAERQMVDLAEAVREVAKVSSAITVAAYRAEVMADRRVRFVDLRRSA